MMQLAALVAYNQCYSHIQLLNLVRRHAQDNATYRLTSSRLPSSHATSVLMSFIPTSISTYHVILPYQGYLHRYTCCRGKALDAIPPSYKNRIESPSAADGMSRTSLAPKQRSSHLPNQVGT